MSKPALRQEPEPGTQRGYHETSSDRLRDTWDLHRTPAKLLGHEQTWVGYQRPMEREREE